MDDELLWVAVQSRIAAKVSKNRMPDVITFVKVFKFMLCHEFHIS